MRQPEKHPGKAGSGTNKTLEDTLTDSAHHRAVARTRKRKSRPLGTFQISSSDVPEPVRGLETQQKGPKASKAHCERCAVILWSTRLVTSNFLKAQMVPLRKACEEDRLPTSKRSITRSRLEKAHDSLRSRPPTILQVEYSGAVHKTERTIHNPEELANSASSDESIEEAR